jgi:hypothetical protein
MQPKHQFAHEGRHLRLANLDRGFDEADHLHPPQIYGLRSRETDDGFAVTADALMIADENHQ